jgi:hypothetical protein
LDSKLDDDHATYEFERRRARAHAVDLKVMKFIDRPSGIRSQKNPDPTSQSEQY